MHTSSTPLSLTPSSRSLSHACTPPYSACQSQAVRTLCASVGFQRGAHVDDPQICSQYEYKVPGGKNPDGSALFGWNDVGAVFCLRCGHRDTEHTLVRDTIERSSRRTSTKGEAAHPLAHKRAVPHAPMQSDVEQLSRAVASTMQLYELEPGVADPLAVLAYEDAKREHEEMSVRLAVARSEKTSNALPDQREDDDQVAETSCLPDENERFKAEVDLFIKQSQVASPTGAKLEALRAPPPEGVAADVGELLKQLNLEQYIENFEKEGMELPVLLALARGDGKEALDAALKETVPVNSASFFLRYWCANEGITIAPLTRVRVATSVDETLQTRAWPQLCCAMSTDDAIAHVGVEREAKP
ncbi:MAG: hypothetical protein SGPRY_005694 [Prymnesium sp.]